MRTAPCQTLTGTRQHGAALLVMLVILITGGAYLLVSHLNRESGRIEAEKKTVAALAQAKEALTGWAVTNSITPGMLPFPDRRNDGNYDGNSDCPASDISTSANVLFGKIPRIGPANPCITPTILGVAAPYQLLNLDVVDGAGEVLWYAVSRNLVSELGVAPIINPGIVNNPQFPWLVVRDASGTILNNRVAFVLIAPGPALPGQDRTVPVPPALPPAVTQFLEGIGGVTNADYDGNYDGGVPTCPLVMCEDFVMSEPWPSAAAPTFNDRLLYVTIDELMPLIEQRVARETRQALIAFRNSTGAFPTAGAVGYIGTSCAAGTSGFLPLPTCDCTRTVNPALTVENIACDCLLDGGTAMISYTFTGMGNYTAGISGACTATAKSCQCTGAGNCSSGAAGPTRKFQCTADGTCAVHNNTSLPSSFGIAYRLPATVTAVPFSATKTPAAPPTCSNPAPSTLLCSDFNTNAQWTVGACAAPLFGLPDWFLASGWKHYLYYAAMPGMTVGSMNAPAVVISTGAALPALGQIRPSSNLNNYLDSVENRNGPPVFTAAGQPLTNIFNDQAVIVDP